jgi:hypothetical protein
MNHIAYWTSIDPNLIHPVGELRDGNYIVNSDGYAIAGPFTMKQQEFAKRVLSKFKIGG